MDEVAKLIGNCCQSPAPALSPSPSLDCCILGWLPAAPCLANNLIVMEIDHQAPGAVTALLLARGCWAEFKIMGKYRRKYNFF